MKDYAMAAKMAGEAAAEAAVAAARAASVAVEATDQAKETAAEIIRLLEQIADPGVPGGKRASDPPKEPK